jgi:putative RecB family exonuclease
MLRTYLEGTDAARIRAVALESKFSHAKSAENILVTGRVDRLDLDAGEYVVVDYKTGQFGATAEAVESSLPLSLYAIATSAVMGRSVERIAVEHLPTGRRVETRRDAERLAGDWAAVVGIVDEMRSGTEFPPEVGPLCRWCDYLSACPEGRRYAAS